LFLFRPTRGADRGIAGIVAALLFGDVDLARAFLETELDSLFPFLHENG
jgi:hypothetical protein